MGQITFLCTPEVSREVTGKGIGGDDIIAWDKNDLQQIKEASEMFAKLKALGYAAFNVVGGKKSGEFLKDFDPNVEEIMMIPATRGG